MAGEYAQGFEKKKKKKLKSLVSEGWNNVRTRHKLKREIQYVAWLDCFFFPILNPANR